MVILTLDLGTSVTKADLWSQSGRLGSGQVDLTTTHPGPGRDEQDPAQWWPAVMTACGLARRSSPDAWAVVTGIGFAAARQTIVATRADGSSVGPALLWSDRRAGVEAAELTRRLGGDAQVQRRTGQRLRATSVAAKLAWLAAHDPDALHQARWILSPRDWVVWRLTGRVATDPTLASASGCYDRAGQLAPELLDVGGSAGPGDRLANRLAEVVASTTVVGELLAPEAADLGLRAGLPVVIGAGDRACEVLGTGARPSRPVVSWGTAANVSAPGWSARDPAPSGLVATCQAVAHGAAPGWTDAWQLEGGISSAGSLLAWLAHLTGQPVDALLASVDDVEPGAGGLVVLPWLDGARAPWWQDDLGAALVGLRPDAGPADVARAVLEGVAFELARLLRLLDPVGSDRVLEDPLGTPAPKPDRPPEAGPPDRVLEDPLGSPAPKPEGPLGPASTADRPGLCLTGRGSDLPAWVEILAGVTGRPVTRRGTGRAAAVGAALLTAAALGQDWSLDHLDPVMAEAVPAPELVARYAALAPAADQVAHRLGDPRP